MIDKKKLHGLSNMTVPQKNDTPTELRGITAKERYQRIAKAAYLRAAAREFIGGDPMQDWLEAEREVDASGKHE